jgi:hypothetical protein
MLKAVTFNGNDFHPVSNLLQPEQGKQQFVKPSLTVYR